MSIEADLSAIERELDALRADADPQYAGLLTARGRGTFERLVSEACELVTAGLGETSDAHIHLLGSLTRALKLPSGRDVEDAIGIIRGALRQIRHRSGADVQTSKPVYVNHTRIDALAALSKRKWDTARLVQMCSELNSAYAHESYISAAMLLRGIIDHIPPIFGKMSFTEVANNHGGKSFKGSMRQLEEGLRHIADGQLHTHIRRKESLPTATQVDFRQSLDVLLGEVEVALSH